MPLKHGQMYRDITYGIAIAVEQSDQILESQETPHLSPSRLSYGVSIVRILQKIDRVITALHCK